MKINIKKTKKIIRVIPKILAKHSFLTFFCFLFIALTLGGIVFYKYIVLIEENEIDDFKEFLVFRKEIYQEVLDYWQKREENFEQANSKQFISPFGEEREEIIIPTTTEEATSTLEESPPEELPPVEPSPEEPELPENIQELLAATNLFEFYILRDGIVPLLEERAIIWEEKGLGHVEEYKGTSYQNMLLLVELKKELTG